MTFKREKEKEKKAKMPFGEVSTKEKIIDEGCIVTKDESGKEEKVCPSDGQKYIDALKKSKARTSGK